MSKSNLEELRYHKRLLSDAIAVGRSTEWCLTLWSRFIKARDLNRCIACESGKAIQAHHIIRRALIAEAQFELGNGITLCVACHKKLHVGFNGRPDLTLLIGAQGADNLDDVALMYQVLLRDARARDLDQDEFYYLSDKMLSFFVRAQGYEQFYRMVELGYTTRLRMAYEIWRAAPENIVQKLLEANGFYDRSDGECTVVWRPDGLSISS